MVSVVQSSTWGKKVREVLQVIMAPGKTFPLHLIQCQFFSDSSTTCWRRAREGGRATAAGALQAPSWRRPSLRIHRWYFWPASDTFLSNSHLFLQIPRGGDHPWGFTGWQPVKHLSTWLILFNLIHNVKVPVSTEKRTSLTNGNLKRARPETPSSLTRETPSTSTRVPGTLPGTLPGTPGTSRNESQLFAVSQVSGFVHFYTWHPSFHL